MKRALLVIGLLSATALTSVGGVAAADPSPPPVVRQAGHLPGSWDGRPDFRSRHYDEARGHWPDRPGPFGHRWPGFERRDLKLAMAGRLSAMETLVGIRSDQLDAWRAYTSALIDFFDHAHSNRQPEAGESLLLGERIADRFLDRVDEAERLSAAADALRAVLGPEQLDRLADAERRLGPRRGPMFHGHGSHRSDAGPRDDAPRSDGDEPT